jgi:uncharacterized protein
MILPDVNVLVYAFRQDVPQYALCRPWLESVIAGDAQFGVSPLVLAGVIRVTTNPRAFKVPTVIEEAFAFCENLVSQPHCRVVQPGERHWDIFKRLCIEVDVRGPLVSDAWLAALAIESGCEWITFDRDFARFPGLTWRPPTMPQA